MERRTLVRVRGAADAARRWTLDPRPAYVAGALLVAGSAVAAAVTWPPGLAAIRPCAVGVLLLLRGAVLQVVARWRARRARSAVPGRSAPGG